MPQIGPLEILVVGVVALIVFGPQRLPEMARSIGKALAEFRRQASDIRSEFTAGLDDDDGPTTDESPADEPASDESEPDESEPDESASPPPSA